MLKNDHKLLNWHWFDFVHLIYTSVHHIHLSSRDVKLGNLCMKYSRATPLLMNALPYKSWVFTAGLMCGRSNVLLVGAGIIILFRRCNKRILNRKDCNSWQPSKIPSKFSTRQLLSKLFSCSKCVGGENWWNVWDKWLYCTVLITLLSPYSAWRSGKLSQRRRWVK